MQPGMQKKPPSECAICGSIPDELGYDGLGAGCLPPEALQLRDTRGRVADPSTDGQSLLTCPACGTCYRLVVDVGFGEWYVRLNRLPTAT